MTACVVGLVAAGLLSGCGYAQAKQVCATAARQPFDGRLDADVAFAVQSGVHATLTVERVALSRPEGAQALGVESVRVLVAGQSVLEGRPQLRSPTRLELAVPGVDVEHVAGEGLLRLQLFVEGARPAAPLLTDVEVCGALSVRYSVL